MSQPIGTKTCCRCKVELPVAQFHRRAASWDGLRAACRECLRAERVHVASLTKAERAAELAARDATIGACAEKECRRCGLTRPRADFAASKRTTDGLRPYCRPCAKAYSHEHYLRNREARIEQTLAWREANRERWAAWCAGYYQANKERLNENYRRWKRENPARHAEWRVRNRALRSGVDSGELDLAALWTGACGICGSELDISVEYPDPLSKSIDHIVPVAKGGAHSQQNLQWAHLRCNIRKSDRITT